MNFLTRLVTAVPKPATAVGSSVLVVAVVNIILGVLNGWHWWAAEPTSFQASVQTVLDVVLGYGAAWVSIVRSKGQTQVLELTPSALPTLQQVTQAPPAAPAEPAKV